MTPYLLLFIVLLSLTFLRGFKQRDQLAYLTFFVMMVLCGWRGKDVGVDTLSYWEVYKSGSQRMEPMFQLLILLCHDLELSVKGFTMSVALLTYLPLAWFIRKCSKDVSFSVFIFLCFSVYFYHETFNTIRASAAVMWAVLAYLYLDNRRFILSFLFFTIAFACHYSAVIVVPFVLIAYLFKHVGFKTVLVLTVISIFFGIAFTIGFGNMANEVVAFGLFQYFDEATWFQHYLEDVDETSYNMVGLLSTMLPFSVFLVSMYDQINSRSLFYKLFLIAVLLQNVFVSVVLTYRITMFFTTLLLVLLPNSYKTSKGFRKITLLGTSAFMVLWYLYLLVIKTNPDRLAGTIPYHF